MADPLRARLFHVVLPDAWRARSAAGARDWQPASLASEGFVHLSFAHQLAGTLRSHFGRADEVLLLELDAARLPSSPVLESSRDGERFPHLYAALPLDAVLRTWLLRRGADGLALPAELVATP